MEVTPIRRINYDIQKGDTGIYETTNYMWHYALRDTKEPLVKQLVSFLQSNTTPTLLRKATPPQEGNNC